MKYTLRWHCYGDEYKEVFNSEDHDNMVDFIKCWFKNQGIDLTIGYLYDEGDNLILEL